MRSSRLSSHKGVPVLCINVRKTRGENCTVCCLTHAGTTTDNLFTAVEMRQEFIHAVLVVAF